MQMGGVGFWLASAVDSSDLGWFCVVEWPGNGGGRLLGFWVILGD